jgi:hypothetical protein
MENGENIPIYVKAKGKVSIYNLPLIGAFAENGE